MQSMQALLHNAGCAKACAQCAKLLQIQLCDSGVRQAVWIKPVHIFLYTEGFPASITADNPEKI